MNVLLRFVQLFLLLTVHVTANADAEELPKSLEEVKINCSTVNTRDECPVNSICSAVNETTKNFQCTCLSNYVWNPLWQRVISDNNANAISNYNNSNSNTISHQLSIVNNVYCLNVAATAANATQSANGKVYVLQPAKVEHLAFGILMVLFVAIVAISLLYLLTILRPIKRSRAVYTLLRRRRENRHRLEEFCDDISMIELKEKL